MKKYLSMFISLVMLLSLAACGSDNSTTKNDPPAGTTSGATSGTTSGTTSGQEIITLMLAYDTNPGAPFDQGANRWAELLEEASGGTMKLELYPSEQLGSQDEVINQVSAGEKIITLADPAFYADMGATDFGVLYCPYLFENWDQVWKLIESDWWKDNCSKLEDIGIYTITSNWMYGARDTLTTKPVTSVDDIKGLKVRVPNTTAQVAGFNALGAVATPMSLSEVYTALQQGTIDGLENPISTLCNGSYYEVAKYLLLDHHVFDFSPIMINVDVYNSLTEQQQKWLTDTCIAAGEYNNTVTEETEQNYLQEMKDNGVTITEMTEDMYAEFAAKAESYLDDPNVNANWSEGVYDTVCGIINS